MESSETEKKFLRVGIIVSSTIMLVCGICVLVLGIVALRRDDRGGGEFVHLSLHDTSAAMQVVLGGLCLVLGKSGLCLLRFGITQRRLNLLSVYYLVLYFLALTTGVVSNAWIIKHSKLIEDTLRIIQSRYGYYLPEDDTSTQASLDFEHFGKNQHVTDQIDATQEHLQCCGAVSPVDYRGSLWQHRFPEPIPLGQTRVPMSCCQNTTIGEVEYCVHDQTNGPKQVYEEGCSVLGKRFMAKYSSLVSIPAFVLSGVIALCLFFLADINFRLETMTRSFTPGISRTVDERSDPATLVSAWPVQAVSSSRLVYQELTKETEISPEKGTLREKIHGVFAESDKHSPGVHEELPPGCTIRGCDSLLQEEGLTISKGEGMLLETKL